MDLQASLNSSPLSRLPAEEQPKRQPIQAYYPITPGGKEAVACFETLLGLIHG